MRDRGLELLEAALVPVLFLRPVGRILHRQHVLRGAGEDREVADLGSDRLDDLDARRADPDDTDALALQLQALGGIGRREHQLPAERLDARDVPQGCGEHPGAGDEELRVDDVALVGVHEPPAATLVVVRGGDPRAELDVLAQIEPVGDVVHPPLDLRLAGELLAPAPVLVELLVEQVLVDVALGVEACARVPVPPPGATDVAGGVERLHPQALLAELVELVEAGHAGPEHHGVQLGHATLPFPVRGHHGG